MRSIVKCSYNKPFVTKHYNSSAYCSLDRYHTTTGIALPVHKVNCVISCGSPFGTARVCFSWQARFISQHRHSDDRLLHGASRTHALLANVSCRTANIVTIKLLSHAACSGCNGWACCASRTHIPCAMTHCGVGHFTRTLCLCVLDACPPSHYELQNGQHTLACHLCIIHRGEPQNGRIETIDSYCVCILDAHPPNHCETSSHHQLWQWLRKWVWCATLDQCIVPVCPGCMPSQPPWAMEWPTLRQ